MFSFLRPNKLGRKMKSVNAYKTKITERRTHLSNLNKEAAELTRIGKELTNIRNRQIPELYRKYSNMRTTYMQRVKSFKKRSRKNLGESRLLVNLFRRNKNVPTAALVNAHKRTNASSTKLHNTVGGVTSNNGVPARVPLKPQNNSFTTGAFARAGIRLNSNNSTVNKK